MIIATTKKNWSSQNSEFFIEKSSFKVGKIFFITKNSVIYFPTPPKIRLTTKSSVFSTKNR